MKKLLIALGLILCLVSPASAGRVVMSYSDSRGGTAANVNSDYPKLLDQARADFTVCNRYHNGWTTVQAINGFTADKAICDGMGTVTDVLILFGINDFLYIGGSSTDVALRIRTLAAIVEGTGATPWIILEPPGPIAWGGYTYMDARKWTRDNVEWLMKLNSIDLPFNLINVRDEFIATYWYSTSCAADHLHPTSLPCRQIIANTISRYLP